MPDSLGTRKKATVCNNHPDQGAETRSHTADQGLATKVTGSLTFTTDGKITGSAGNFTAFAFDNPILVEGTNLNNGFKTVLTIAGDGSYITVDPPPKAEGPISCTLRTA